MNIFLGYEEIVFFYGGGGHPRSGLLGVIVRKTAWIRKRYNQVPHLSQETKWERNKLTINITNKSQEFGSEQTRKHDKHKM